MLLTNPDQIRAVWLRQWAQMESAGIPALRVAEILAESGPASQAGSAPAAFKRYLASGVQPPAAAARAGLVSDWHAQILQGAYEGGRLEGGLKMLADDLEARTKRVKAFRSQMALPVLILFASAALSALPGLVSGAFGLFGFALRALLPTALLIGGFAGFLRLTQNAFEQKNLVPSWLLRLPFLGQLTELRAQRDYLTIMAMGLKSGIPAFRAMDLASAAAITPATATASQSARQFVEDGVPVAQALDDAGIFSDPTGYQLVVAGEHAGRLDEMIAMVASRLDERVGEMADQLAQWIPRVVYAFVALQMVLSIVGFWTSIPGID